MKTLQLLTMIALMATVETDVSTVPNPPSYNSGGVVVMCADTGLVLYGNEYHTHFYPASITKVMTALVVLDHVRDLNESVTFSHNAVFSIPRNSSHISMDVDETLSVYQALYALMVRSANEVAIALAEHVAGSVEEFAALMNHRAVSLGAMNTHFVNPTGLPATGHTTTAYDMALVMREAVRLYPLFSEILATRQFAIPPTQRQPETRYLNTTNQLIRPGTSYFDTRVIGSKTGWTHAAGNTLVTYATHEGRRLIVTILQGSGTDPYRETKALLDYAFNLPYEERVVFNAATYMRTVSVYREAEGEAAEPYPLTLQAKNDLLYRLPVNYETPLSYTLTVPEKVSAPVSQGDIIGSVAVYTQNVYLGTVDLLATSTVALLPPAPPAAEEAESASHLPINNPQSQGYNPPSYNGFWDILRDIEQWEALAVPLTVTFFGLLISVLVFATRRRRKMKQLFHIDGDGGKRYANSYYSSYRYR
jgi:D-alanyl-D-alanine carboxypeptidase (penicillin-binding protein 5/6)